MLFKGNFLYYPNKVTTGKEIGPKCQLERSLRGADKTRFDVKGLKAEETLGECIETRLSYKCWHLLFYITSRVLSLSCSSYLYFFVF